MNILIPDIKMKNLYSILVLFASLWMMISCVDDDFDHPPLEGEDPDITVTTTISELKAMHTLGAYEEITEDLVISGIIISDDRFGNFFRAIVLQDETGGIEIRMNETDLYNEYGRGRRVFVKCKGLWLGDYNGVTQLGGEPVANGNNTEISRLPSALFDVHILKGKWNQVVEPKLKTIDQLTADDVNTLVQLENMQFSLSDCNRTYAIDYTDPNGVRIQETLNQPLMACSGANSDIVLRSSGYATFASSPLPVGSGTITAVYTVFGTTKQLYIRDTDDVDFDQDRCDGGGQLISLKDLRAMYNGTTIQISEPLKIQGTVISDAANENIASRNLVIQDGTGGMYIRFTSNHGLQLGEQVEISIEGSELSLYSDLLQVNEVETSQVFALCSVAEVEPKVVTVADIQADPWGLQSTLVKIVDAKISGNGIFSGNTLVTDATGEVTMYTQSYASFASVNVPSSQLNLTAIVGAFNGTQISIRNLDDLEGDDINFDPEYADIAQIRDLFNGSTRSIANNWLIKGHVISNHTSGNTVSQNIVFQDSTAGLTIRFAENHNYAEGTELTINVYGLELSDYRSLLQLNNVPLNQVVESKSSNSPDPQVVSIQELLTNGEAYESTLVRINGVTIGGGSGVYNGTIKISDGTNQIDLYTRSQATFANSVVPAGQVDIIGFVSEFDNTRQISIRTLDDIIQ